jgi:hypothetical protein
LILENGTNNDRDAESIVELRNELGLPQPERIHAGAQSALVLPLVRVPRLDVGALSDDDLVQLYHRAIMVGGHVAIARLAQEAVRRPSLAERLPPSDAYRRLVATEREPERALAIIDAARAHSKSIGESTAPWDLAELELHLASGNPEEAKQSLARIEREHHNDPEVAAALYRLLYATGVIPDEMAQRMPGDEEVPMEAVGTAPEPAAGRILTPDSDRPAGGKSALWTPS